MPKKKSKKVSGSKNVKSTSSVVSPKSELKGFKGWLLVITVILFIALFNSILVMSLLYEQISALSVFEHFIVIVASAFILILFYKRSRLAPKATIYYVWTLLVIKVFSNYFLDLWSYTVLLLFNFVVNVAITKYFTRSKRVKNTFVN